MSDTRSHKHQTEKMKLKVHRSYTILSCSRLELDPLRIRSLASDLLTFLIFIMECCETSLRIRETESCQPFSHLTASPVHNVHTSRTRSLGTLPVISPRTYKQQNHRAQINPPRYQHKTPINTFRFSDLTSKKCRTVCISREGVLCHVPNVKQATTLCF